MVIHVQLTVSVKSVAITVLIISGANFYDAMLTAVLTFMMQYAHE